MANRVERAAAACTSEVRRRKIANANAITSNSASAALTYITVLNALSIRAAP